MIQVGKKIKFQEISVISSMRSVINNICVNI